MAKQCYIPGTRESLTRPSAWPLICTLLEFTNTGCREKHVCMGKLLTTTRLSHWKFQLDPDFPKHPTFWMRSSRRVMQSSATPLVSTTRRQILKSGHHGKPNHGLPFTTRMALLQLGTREPDTSVLETATQILHSPGGILTIYRRKTHLCALSHLRHLTLEPYVWVQVPGRVPKSESFWCYFSLF